MGVGERIGADDDATIGIARERNDSSFNLGRIPHRNFPGGRYFRRPALVLAMLWFRILDLL